MAQCPDRDKNPQTPPPGTGYIVTPRPAVSIHLLQDLPPHLHTAAAAFYWRHFGNQVLPFPARARQGIRLIRAAMRADHTLVALSSRGQLVGIAGLRDTDGGILTAGSHQFRTVWGNAHGCLHHLGTRLYRAGPPTPDLVIDGIAIHPAWRRRGIARVLVRTVADHARTRGHMALRAEVADANRAGLAAWYAMGFSGHMRHRLGWPWSRRAHVLRLPIGPEPATKA